MGAVLGRRLDEGRDVRLVTAARAGRTLPSSVKGSGMAGGHAGGSGGFRARRGPGRRVRRRRAPRLVAEGPTKSRWRTSTNAPSAPTNATTAPMSIRWFSVAEKPTW